MINLGISQASLNSLITLLRQPHFISINIRLLTLQHEYKQDLSKQFVSGSVSVDMDADITRALDLTLFDPSRKIHVDPDTSSSTAVFIADMISIVYTIQNPSRTQTFNIPIFTGPIDDVNRDDTFLYLKCVGKEKLSLDNLWIAKTYRKNARKTDVIRDILRWRIGETRIQVPTLSSRLPNDLKLTREKVPWTTAKSLAAGMGYYLFYDGRGYATMRRTSGAKSILTFDDRYITERPQVDYDLTAVKNVVEVIGSKPKKAKTNIKYVAVAPASHPLSPYRLGRNGVPRYIFESIQDDSIDTKAEAKNLATRRLNGYLLSGYDVQWNGAPVPFLEEYDIVRVNSGDVNAYVHLRKFTIPLGIEPASYGHLRKIKPRGGAKGVAVPKPKKRPRR